MVKTPRFGSVRVRSPGRGGGVFSVGRYLREGVVSRRLSPRITTTTITTQCKKGGEIVWRICPGECLDVVHDFTSAARHSTAQRVCEQTLSNYVALCRPPRVRCSPVTNASITATEYRPH